MTTYEHKEMFDIIGVGLGPFNLGLAALLDPVPDVRALFFEQKPQFDWHSGMILEGTTLQVPFFADLVTMADPTSRYTFLNYLREHDRLYHFYFLERFLIPREEYNLYGRWVSGQLEICRFRHKVTRIDHVEENGISYFRVEVVSAATKQSSVYHAKDLVLGVGSVPDFGPQFQGFPEEDIFHSARFKDRLDRCRKAKSITVIGSGQSAGEVFYKLLQEQKDYGYRLDWFTRSGGFFPMEYSKLGLEHFSPDYIYYFYSLPQEKRDDRLKTQDLWYKGMASKWIADIYDLLYERTIGNREVPFSMLAHTEVQKIEQVEGKRKYRLSCFHREQEKGFTHESEVVIFATGYEHRIPSCVKNLSSLIQWDEKKRYRVELDYRLKLTKEIDNRIFVQNAELHTHGVGSPDLGLGCYRNSVIINQLAGKEVYPVRKRNVFQQFGVSESDENAGVKQPAEPLSVSSS
ncbi:lysine N(6)-hydroxylase/L-ornithine N(5)-oxygenase family protein [Thermoactinomyces mirandus]|uniref:L-lysine N6-monooxygenase MbtG n=1 Tax=Thermoactinomyces mirandus TaxID=2756294 RepID=A0A7W1XT69_9BACL|nr:lysine N(6)-hydroxylase/L-ornithine N(5)-oxygenase family protein [Thermoactinomyces mirandus]MBA4602818.1 lysine N(6)-hydroxylase/L-ornithine N(5)-oxygenase family protein [Thermoactinomyces mirandus]